MGRWWKVMSNGSSCFWLWCLFGSWGAEGPMNQWWTGRENLHGFFLLVSIPIIPHIFRVARPPRKYADQAQKLQLWMTSQSFCREIRNSYGHLDTKNLPGTFHSTIPSFHHPIIPSQGTLDRQHLIRTCFVDFDRSIVLVAEVDKAIMGAGRISREEMSDDFTFSLQVLPECRKKGGMAKGLRGGSCAVEVGDWRDWWPLFDFFLNWIITLYIIYI